MNKFCFLLLFTLLTLSACEPPEVEKKLVKDFSYCLESDDTYPLPTIGDVRSISVSLSVSDGSVKELNGSARCEYKASMCENNFRRDLWHGNQEQEKQALKLSSGHELIFFPHGACLQMSDYLKNCPNENCNASEKFEILVMLPQQKPDRKMIPYSELRNVIGTEVLNLDVVLKSESNK